MNSRSFRRPSPLPPPTLGAEFGKGKRQLRPPAYHHHQVLPAPWEPIEESRYERAFCYKSIEESKGRIMSSRQTLTQDPWIRLLRISPRSSEVYIRELITVQLHEHPPYKAISYAWGDAVNTTVFFITQDDHQGWLKIPTNLKHALAAVQHDTEYIMVWADSICINQRDNREKTQQLSMISDIYGKAEQVVVWLGVEKDNSAQAHRLLHGLTHTEMQIDHDTDLNSIVSLFDRDYWSRLWVVQEILHARDIVVQCGALQLTWSDYTQASKLFQTKKDFLAKIPNLVHGSYDFTRPMNSHHKLSPLQILIYHGPASISHIEQARELYSDDPFSFLLHLLRLSRTKLASDPKDRVFGIFGILPDEVRDSLRVNYLLPVREIYLDVVQILLQSGNMDVICESIHFPHHISNANLPSWVPDWSYDPMSRSLASLPLSFSAGINQPPSFTIYEERLGARTRSKLLIDGVRIGTIEAHGMAVSTHSRAVDYCMAFLQWRALLLQHFDIGSVSVDESEDILRHRVASCEQQRNFCLTLSLGQPIRKFDGKMDMASKGTEEDLGMEWIRKCYCVFATTIKARLPKLPIDEDLRAFAEFGDNTEPGDAARQFLQDCFAEYMMGRCFCITDSGHLGLGTGAMARGDVVVVPYGCSTPVLLRPEGSSSVNFDEWRDHGSPHDSSNSEERRPQEYRFVGDVYIHGYMDGEAIREASKENFMLH